MKTIARTKRSAAPILMGLAMGGVIPAMTVSHAGAFQPPDDVIVAAPLVEYVRVAAELCLQPSVVSGHPSEAELLAAQKRWLTKEYPGYWLNEWRHELALVPELRDSGHENDSPKDWMEIETADGKPISVCFSRAIPEAPTVGKTK